MEKWFKAAVWALIAANAAYPLSRWAMSSAQPAPEREIHPEALAVLDPAQREALRAKAEAADSAPCLRMSSLAEPQAASAMSALGGQAGAKIFKSEPGSVWRVRWGGAGSERDSGAKAAELSRASGLPFAAFQGPKGWGARSDPFDAQAEAAAAMKRAGSAGLALDKEAAQASVEVRFGPWPRAALADLAAAASGWGAAAVAECTQKEREEWEKAK